LIADGRCDDWRIAAFAAGHFVLIPGDDRSSGPWATGFL